VRNWSGSLSSALTLAYLLQRSARGLSATSLEVGAAHDREGFYYREDFSLA
jgi:hypothetical protein